MLPFKRTFESEKNQLQELNCRLAQYLSRTKQLEQENTHLICEINQLRQAKTAEWEPRYKAEMRDLRRMVEQLSFEKSQAEMEREKIWRELQMVQSLCNQQTDVCRDISGELQGCEQELGNAHKTNSELQQRVVQLQNEYKRLEDAHRHQIGHLRRQVDSRMAPIVTQTYRGPPAATMEEVQEYAHGLSQGWIETFEMYQQKIEDMEQSIKADQAKLSDLQREKMLYASELDKMRKDAEKQGHIQMRLEEQLMDMQEKFSVDLSEYQMVIEQLEHERNMMCGAIEEKMRQHQELLQVKMDLGLEVAAYRALLEGEQDVQRRVNQQQRERIIDIKMPAQPYTPRTTSMRQHMDIRYTPTSTSHVRRSPVPQSGSRSPSRVIPISVARHQSPASRRDMISFTKARAAASAPPAAEQVHKTSSYAQKTVSEEKTVKIKQAPQVDQQRSPLKSPTAESASVRVLSPPMTSPSKNTETGSKRNVQDKKEKVNEFDRMSKDREKAESAIGPDEKKILDSVSVEEIIEKVIKPAGLEAKVCQSGDSKVRYHVEKTEQEDGTIKTQIVLESKVEEELDVSEDDALDEFLSHGVKKVALEDIKDTATGGMIKDLISGLQGGENLQNKSINVEIIEEPVESQSDEECEVEEELRCSFNEPSSNYFQIEELENVPHEETRVRKSDDDDAMKAMTDTDHWKGGSVHILESESSYLPHEQEPHEYFVSTPDDNYSEPEDGGGITSYGHYGIVDDLSDERYYQDEGLPSKRVIVEESEYKFTSGEHPFVKESFPECIIEEEIRVSPIVQESVLGLLREDSLEPKEQLKGALEKLQGSVSGPLREELAFLTKVSSENPQNVAVDIKKVQQSSDNGTMTIVAELNVSQSLEESGLLEGDDLSEEQIMAALRSSNLGFENAFQGGARGGYSVRVSTEEEVAHGEGFEGVAESMSEITERHIKLGPSEKAFTFQMDVQDEHQEQGLHSPMKISQEKRVTTVYLDSPSDD